MGRLCMGCYESYSSNVSLLVQHKREDEVFYICPRRSCQGEIVEIDDILIPTIILLNERGYYTESSCSGHMEEDSPTAYIVFEEIVQELPDIPKGYRLEAIMTNDGSRRLSITREIMGDNSIRTFQGILTNALQTYAWAVQLPYADHLEEVIFEDLFGGYYYEEEYSEEKKDQIDPEKIKKDIKSSTIKFNDFVDLAKDKDDKDK